MSLDDAICSYNVECLLFPVIFDMPFVPMFRWSSLVDHVRPFFCFLIDSLVSSHRALVDSRVQLFSTLISGVALFSSAQLFFFPRCYQRSIVIISLLFYSLEIKQLFPPLGYYGTWIRKAVCAGVSLHSR